MIRISGTFRQMSTQMPAGTLIQRLRAILISASSNPKNIENKIPISAISRLTRNPSTMKRKLLPVHSHSQLSGSTR